MMGHSRLRRSFFLALLGCTSWLWVMVPAASSRPSLWPPVAVDPSRAARQVWSTPGAVGPDLANYRSERNHGNFEKVHTGQSITYVLNSRNNGPAATQALLRAAFNHPSVVVQAVTPDRGSCRSAPAEASGLPQVECQVGLLDVEEQVTVTVDIQPLESGRLVNSASFVPLTPGTGYRELASDNVVTVRPTIQLRGLARRCTRHSFAVQMTILDLAMSRVDIYLDGRRLRSSRRPEFSLRVPVGRLRRGQHRLLVVTTNQRGEQDRRRFPLRRC